MPCTTIFYVSSLSVSGHLSKPTQCTSSRRWIRRAQHLAWLPTLVMDNASIHGHLLANVFADGVLPYQHLFVGVCPQFRVCNPHATTSYSISPGSKETDICTRLCVALTYTPRRLATRTRISSRLINPTVSRPQSSPLRSSWRLLDLS